MDKLEESLSEIRNINKSQAVNTFGFTDVAENQEELDKIAALRKKMADFNFTSPITLVMNNNPQLDNILDANYNGSVPQVFVSDYPDKGIEAIDEKKIELQTKVSAMIKNIENINSYDHKDFVDKQKELRKEINKINNDDDVSNVIDETKKYWELNQKFLFFPNTEELANKFFAIDNNWYEELFQNFQEYHNLVNKHIVEIESQVKLFFEQIKNEQKSQYDIFENMKLSLDSKLRQESIRNKKYQRYQETYHLLKNDFFNVDMRDIFPYFTLEKDFIDTLEKSLLSQLESLDVIRIKIENMESDLHDEEDGEFTINKINIEEFDSLKKELEDKEEIIYFKFKKALLVFLEDKLSKK